MKSISILIIEDEASIRDMIQFALVPDGFTIIEAGDVTTANQKIANHIPDLILLDWMLPGTSGIEFAKQLKRDPNTKNIPIIILTARAEEDNKIKGFEIGADDYITKPFSPRELSVRIKAVLRRGPLISPEDIIQVKNLRLNISTHQLTINDDPILLTPIEYKLLYFFVTHQERVYSREQLLDYVWGKVNYIDERTVDVQIRRLRNRLKPHGYNCCIRTIRGSGYQFTTNGLL